MGGDCDGYIVIRTIYYDLIGFRSLVECFSRHQDLGRIGARVNTESGLEDYREATLPQSPTGIRI